MQTPLSDVTVVDFTRARAGPWCTQILGILGAEIIKIERVTGTGNRHSYPEKNGMGVNFISRNRNKKSVTVDLKDERGVQLVEDLIARADVLVENFSLGVMERFGLGYEYLSSEVNPELVYASIKGYGEEGPYKNRRAVDPVIQAEGGMMSVTGPEGGPPVKAGQAISDIGGGLYGVIGIMTALYHREQSGDGQKFETNLLGTMVSFMEEYLTMYGITGENPEPLGTRHQTGVPCELFETKDSQIYLYVTDWESFVKEVLEEDRLLEYASMQLRQENYDDIMDVMRPRMREKTTEEWQEIFDEMGFPNGPLNQISDVIEHPQARERGYVFEYDDPHIGEVTLHGHPLHFSKTGTEMRSGPPQLGEHNDEVLSGYLGFTDEEIEQLREDGVIS